MPQALIRVIPRKSLGRPLGKGEGIIVFKAHLTGANGKLRFAVSDFTLSVCPNP